MDGLMYPLVISLGLTGIAVSTASTYAPEPQLSDSFRVYSIEVKREGDTASMKIKRSILAPITMGFTVRIMEETETGLRQFCKMSSAPFEYQPGAAPLDGVTLDWWTDGACPNLPPGPAQIVTTWVPANNRMEPLTVIAKVNGK